MTNHTSDPRSTALVLPFNVTFLGSEYRPLKPGMMRPCTRPYWLLMKNSLLVVHEADGTFQLPEGDLPPWCPASSSPPLCVGIWRDRPLFAAPLDKTVEIPEPYRTVSFQGPDATLDEHLSTLAGTANQVMEWERKSVYCGCCGTMMDRIPLTWGKVCPSCHAEYFPNIHPCIIVLVKRGEEFLLVRKAEWAPGRFSLIAGFLEIGESLEECVQREVLEETGVTVKNIRYVGSQNWPFPGQEMIGFIAEHAEGEPRPDGIEIVEARWFTVDTMPCYPGNVRSISRWIMKNYCI